MVTINISHLKFQRGCNTWEPHEEQPDPTDIWHPCVNWCFQQGMNVEFYAEFDEDYQDIEEVLFEGEWQEVENSTRFPTFATFQNDTDAVTFALNWSEPE